MRQAALIVFRRNEARSLPFDISGFQQIELVSYISGMALNYWLVKSEPETYSWADFVEEGKAAWTGVRNFAARNHLRAMKKNDRVFFYHSGEAKEVVGLAHVTKESYPDPTADEGDWSAVDLAPEKTLAQTVALTQIKADKVLSEMVLTKQPRLSVSPVTRIQFERLLQLANRPV